MYCMIYCCCHISMCSVLWWAFTPCKWWSLGTAIWTVGVSTSELDLLSLMPLFGQLQLGAAHYYYYYYYYYYFGVRCARPGESEDTLSVQRPQPDTTNPWKEEKNKTVGDKKKKEQIMPTGKHWLCSWNPPVPHHQTQGH